MPLFVNSKPVASFNFPGGECSVNVSDVTIRDRVEVLAYLYTSDDIMQLLLTVNAIRIVNPDASVHLTVPYFPYARQDRVCNVGEAFSLQVMASLVNSLGCESVTVVDPHSAKTMELLQRAREITQMAILRASVVEALIRSKNLLLLAPDKGAVPKLRAYQSDLVDRGVHVDLECCHKVRDPKTGQILRTEVPELNPDRGVLIVDDICDGGRTFAEIAKVIKERGRNSLYLYVTHGIFSKGFEPLKDFQQIFCYHTFRKPNAEEAQLVTTIGDVYVD